MNGMSERRVARRETEIFTTALEIGRVWTNPTPDEVKQIVKLSDAYLLNLFVGFLGLHHFYLKRNGFGILYLCTFGLLGVGMIIDLFRLPHLVKQANKKITDPNSPEKKDMWDAYVLWFPLGLLGFHHFYLERNVWGVAYLCTFGLFGVGWLSDAVRMKHLVHTTNENDADDEDKDLWDAYVLTLVPITGILGGQHYYLGRYGFGVLYTFTLGLLGVGWLGDICRMPFLVEHVNEGDDEEKRLDDAYLLCIPLGFLGLHHFYIERKLWGVLYFFTLGLLGIGWVVDCVRLRFLVADFNENRS